MQNEALYRSLYSKYAPNLTAGELEKKLKYAYTLDPNEFINAFYKKYTGGPPTAKQSKYISSIIGTTVLRKDLIYTKPKNSQQAIESVKNIRTGIDRNDPDVINAIAEDYFNTDNISKKYEEVYQGGIDKGITYRVLPTTDGDLKKYFESVDSTGKKTGDFTKFEQYKEYQETDVFNLDWVDESTISNAVKNRQRQRQEQYILDIDDDEVRQSAQTAAEEIPFEIFDDPADLAIFTRYLEGDRKLQKQYDDDVTKFGLHNQYVKKENSKADKFLTDYLTKKQKELERDTFNWDIDVKRFEDIKNKYEKQLTEIEKEAKALGKVTETLFLISLIKR